MNFGKTLMRSMNCMSVLKTAASILALKLQTCAIKECDQRELLLARHPLDLELPPRRGRPVRASFEKGEFYRPARARVLCSDAFVVRSNASLYVVGDAAIKRSIGTAQQIAYPI
jgi:hypothetical protein